MSGIFGIYHPSEKPIRNKDIQQMATSSAHRGADGIFIKKMPHIVFGHCATNTTPQSLSEDLPFYENESKLLVTTDARIDNRKNLAKKLSIPVNDTLTDRQLIICAFKKWGVECFSRLIGDFAIVLWDEQNQTLICARDYIGIKPFYYHYSTKKILFASEIKALAEYEEFPLTINEGMVGEYLTFSFSSKTETLYTQIDRLAPGHYLVAKQGRLNIYKYYPQSTLSRIRYKKPSEYAEHFMEIFQEAVQCRLRAHGPVSAELSGGLDSSTIVGLASRLINDQPLHAYSLLFPGKPFDEREFIDAVVSCGNIVPTFIDYDETEHNISFDQEINRTWEPPFFPNMTMNDPLLQSVAGDHSKILLSGIGGDECFASEGYAYFDYLVDFKFKMFFITFLSQLNQTPKSAIKKLILSCFWPVTPYLIRSRLLKIQHSSHLPHWLTKSFIKRNNLIDRIYKSDSRLFLSNICNTPQGIFQFDPAEQFFFETIDRHRAVFGIENRYPFYDQRLTDFAMAIPDYIRGTQDQSKCILRSRENKYLPQIIKNRNDKAEFSFVFNQSFNRMYTAVSKQQFPLFETGWIDEIEFKKMMSNRKIQLEKNPFLSACHNWEIWFAFSMTAWYNIINR